MTHYGSLPFAEAIEYLKTKVPQATEHWDDIEGQAHDHAFIVAGAAKADLLTDLHGAVLKGIAQGTTLEEFRRDFDAITAKHGWSGFTGDGSEEGRAWRTKVIYGTNLRTAHQAGRLSQARAIQAERPYWRYRHNDTVTHPRPEHQAWNGKVLSADDPWWATHYPPNGWGCRCYIETLAPRDLKREGITIDPAPDDGTYEHVDRNGEPHTLPKGVDYGWDHQPGSTRDLVAEVKARAGRMPGEIGKDLNEDLSRLRLPPHLAQIRQTEAQLIGRKVETTVVFDQAGKELLRKTGDAFSVGFARGTEQAQLKDAVVTHTHPVVSSFSREDIELLLQHDAAVVRAVDAQFDYEARRPAGGWQAGERDAVQASAEAVEAQEWGRWTDRLLRGEITEAEFNAGLYHAIWEQVAAVTRLEYERVVR